MVECVIKSIRPSIFVKEGADGLEQMIRIVVSSSGNLTGAEVAAEHGGAIIGRQKYDLRGGENTLEFFITEASETQKVLFRLTYGEAQSASREIGVTPPRHWVVHVVQLSHHDLGYTDLASNVQKEMARYLNEAITYAGQTESYPDDAKFRIVIEQAWSLDSFFKTAEKEQKDKMIRLLQSGQFEMTALYGNMVSEICGHETLVRAAYRSAEISRRCGIPVVSAEHNDVPGISWGLSEVMADIGVKIFCPGLPLYYSWSNPKFRSFWNMEEIFGNSAPGAFWWETPTGKRVLFWCNNQGCGGDTRGAMPNLEAWLENAAENGFPYSVIRHPVGGGNRDNSPYIRAYADTVRKWNEKWAYPRLICSTNAKFYEDFSKIIPESLPVWRGELPGQDYPSGSSSTAIPTSVNRRNHNALISAEKLASAASLHTDYVYQAGQINEAYEESILYDEHTWGYHFPAGPAARASEYEKALRAFRAEAFAAEVRDKAMAYIADGLKLKAGEIYLVVFNQTSWTLNAPMSVNMREMDGTGSVMHDTGEVLRGVALDYRWHVYPDISCIDGSFDLIDEVSGESVPYDVTELNDAFEPVDFAPQRVGLAQGTKRYGYYEDPKTLRYNICFNANDIPAHGYKAYRLRMKNGSGEDSATENTDNTNNTENMIENEYYRIAADPKTMQITSIRDKEADREIVDADGGDFYRFIVRDDNSGAEKYHDTRFKLTSLKKNTYSEMQLESSAAGHPVIRHRIRLCAGIKNIYFETSVFKDPTPLLNSHLAFPLKADNPRFRYESALSIMEPAKDYLPGAYSDLIAAQNWVRIQDGDYYMLWSSADAVLAGFCKLWPGYVSPAHRCYVGESFRHDPQTEPDYRQNGWIFSQLFNNNFGTNFSVSHTGFAVFRYCLTSGNGVVSDSDAAKWGWQVSSPQTTLFTDRASDDGIFAPRGEFLECDNSETAVLNWKAAEDGGGYIVRLWNVSDKTQVAALNFKGFMVAAANLTNMVEVDLPDEQKRIKIKQNTCVITAKAKEILNVRLHLICI
ncbi:MAG: glycosyl hydrolase-related protein [Oscillospiraceae bacterium]|nr:glycosyl hydrolase-related protein [Oscillospiraceae bacterium]